VKKALNKTAPKKQPPAPTWFFSPPVGPSIDPASLDDIVHHIRQDDEHWNTEAPATADDYCRENFAPFIWSNREEGFRSVSATIYYIDRGRFTIGVSGAGITDPSQAANPETGLRIPSTCSICTRSRARTGRTS
jgi:hypothetical protein